MHYCVSFIHANFQIPRNVKKNIENSSVQMLLVTPIRINSKGLKTTKEGYNENTTVKGLIFSLKVRLRKRKYHYDKEVY